VLPIQLLKLRQAGVFGDEPDSRERIAMAVGHSREARSVVLQQCIVAPEDGADLVCQTLFECGKVEY
jgi:hypothetical protein